MDQDGRRDSLRSPFSKTWGHVTAPGHMVWDHPARFWGTIPVHENALYSGRPMTWTQCEGTKATILVGLILGSSGKTTVVETVNAASDTGRVAAIIAAMGEGGVDGSLTWELIDATSATFLPVVWRGGGKKREQSDCRNLPEHFRPGGSTNMFLNIDGIFLGHPTRHGADLISHLPFYGGGDSLANVLPALAIRTRHRQRQTYEILGWRTKNFMISGQSLKESHQPLLNFQDRHTSG